jgi:dihydropteroate synthase
MENIETFQIQCGSKILDLSHRTHIMGILNVTPDSFSDGGKYFDSELAIERGIQMTEDGADIIDIGAESTRPGAEPVSAGEELQRIIPVLDGLLKQLDVLISVDTYKSSVAEAVLKAGAHLINDISGLRFDPKMSEVVAKYQVPVIIMHIKGQPRNMQQNPYYDDLIGEIYEYLAEGIQLAEGAGIKQENIIIDPGIGFGKRLMDNYEILRRLNELKGLGCPILIGPSRKSFIGRVLDLPIDQRLEGTIAAVAIGIQNGAHIVRVHDVKQIAKACRIIDLLVGKASGSKCLK